MSLPDDHEPSPLVEDDATRRELLRLLRGSAYATPVIVTLLASRDAHASLVLCDPLVADCGGDDETPPDAP